MLTEEDIGKRVEELCVKHRFSRYRLAQLTGMTQTALGNIISGSSMPTIPTLEKICEAFGITLSQFFAEGDRPDLTRQQRELLDTWENLDRKEQELLTVMLDSIRKE